MGIPSEIKSVPNVAAVCVDASLPWKIEGRIYHRYREEPMYFSDVMPVLQELDALCDKIFYPQATVRPRTFGKLQRVVQSRQKAAPVTEAPAVLEKRGKQATFCVAITSRANASWQGKVYWAEQERMESFCSERELLVLILRAVGRTGADIEKEDCDGRQEESNVSGTCDPV